MFNYDLLYVITMVIVFIIFFAYWELDKDVFSCYGIRRMIFFLHGTLYLIPLFYLLRCFSSHLHEVEV